MRRCLLLLTAFAFACAEGDGDGEVAAAAAAATDAPPQPQDADQPFWQPAGPQPGSPTFAAYTEAIGDSGVTFDMVPIPGGTVTIGSPPGEPGRDEDEGPRHRVVLEPFWMARHEVRWDEYDTWYEADLPQSKMPDGVSKPTPPYVDMTFNMGRKGFPVICVSHTAARQYCAWLSGITGRFYRLPTEAEWEHACRAGSASAWSFGDDGARLAEHAWFADNSAEAYHPVGQKLPNAWGLHDMHGNVAEWVADHYLADAYAPGRSQAPRTAPFFPPPQDPRGRPVRFPHVTRGGSWKDPPAELRSAARRSSEPAWNGRDPQIPRSWWYLTEGQLVGFRVVRPLREPTPEERARFEQL